MGFSIHTTGADSIGSGSTGGFGFGGIAGSRENSEGQIVEWARFQMTKPMQALELHAEDIGEIGQVAARSIIQEEDRIDTGDMLAGVEYVVTPSRADGVLNVKVGWDLANFRDGYPELQDQGYQAVTGMQALDYGLLQMEIAAQKIINEATR